MNYELPYNLNIIFNLETKWKRRILLTYMQGMFTINEVIVFLRGVCVCGILICCVVHLCPRARCHPPYKAAVAAASPFLSRYDPD